MTQLFGCDLVHCFRRHDRIADLEELSRRGVAISFDNDDDFAASDMVGGKSTLDGRRIDRQLSAAYDTAARLADLVTTPSPPLAEKYRAAGAQHVVVIDNYLDRGMSHFGQRTGHDGIVVGWVAGLEHAADLPHVNIVESLSRLLAAHSHVRVLTVGLRLPIQSDRYEHIKGIPLARLLEVTSRFDIGIAPLADNAFNRGRSTIKLKEEYGGGGAAWLASPVGPYRDLGSKQGGCLVDDDGWSEALDGWACSQQPHPCSAVASGAPMGEDADCRPSRRHLGERVRTRHRAHR